MTRPLWAVLVVISVVALTVLGPLDYEAAVATAERVKEVEGALAPAFGVVDPFAGAERDTPFRITSPLACGVGAEQWIRSWGDGRSPFERQAGGRLPFECVNADLRRRIHGT